MSPGKVNCGVTVSGVMGLVESGVYLAALMCAILLYVIYLDIIFSPMQL